MATIDLLSLLLPYGKRTLKVKAKATGYTDSDFSNEVEYISRPKIARLDGTHLRISNCRAAATSYEIYLAGTLAGTAAYAGADGGTLDVDISTLGFTNQAINLVYVKGIGTGVEANQSKTLGFWYGNNVILGVSGMYQSDPALVRTDDAVGKTWTLSSNLISSDFDSLFPYNLMQRETDGDDVFVYIPEMYWRIGYDSSNRITDIAVAPCEMTAGTNQVCAHSDAFYYGAYGANVASSQMYSKTGVARTGNMTRANFRTSASARGSNYRQLDLYHMNILNFLWLIEFATKNSDAVMMGYTTYGGATGATDGLTVPTGQLYAGGRMRYRYIEDFIGNDYEFFDGIWGLYATDDPTKYGESNEGIAFSSVAGNNLSALKIDTTKPLLAVHGESVSNGSYNTYFCDYAYLAAGYLYCRGRYGSGANNGLFYWNYSSATGSSALIGSRLLKTL